MSEKESAADPKQVILVIDDEEVVRFLFQSLLEEEGYRAILAADGREGVEMLNQHKPAVALVDKNLPDMSGVDLIANQKKRHPDTEFVMITGYASLDSAVKALEVGAFSYLTKPFDDMDVVMDRIRAALEVNNLRVETSLLRDRLNNIDGEVSQEEAKKPTLNSLPHRLVDQVLYTISFLESFVDKRDKAPTPATWARNVDMIEETARLLKQAFEGKEPS
jgi:DNA-binding NtrC family response regulator